jgi:hypothetical protein
MTPSAALAWGACLALAASGCSRAGATAPSPPPPARRLAIRAAEPLLAKLREGGFFRFALPRLGSEWKVEAGPEAQGDLLVVIAPAPVDAAHRLLARDLPVELGDGGAVLDGTPCREPDCALAIRLPGASRSVWLVTGGGEEAALRLASEILFRLAATGHEGDRGASGRWGGPLTADYLLRATPYLERSGRWVKVADGHWAVDRATERNDLADRDRAFAQARVLRGERVDLRLAPGVAETPELARLAGELDRDAQAMAARIPIAVSARLQVLVEPDYVAQGRNTGQVGEAVPGGPADLHLVFDPRDGFAYRFALAGRLLARAGYGERLPPWLLRGAALWLSRDWYGRPYGEWIPTFAAAEVLPEARDLLAPEEARDGSRVLWTPVAAAVVERLLGRTLSQKLAQVPAEPRVAAILGELARSAGRSAKVPAVSRSARVPGDSPWPRLPPFLHGVSLAMSNSLEGGYHAPAMAARLDALRRLGVDAVSLMPFAFQETSDRPGLGFIHESPGGETDVGLIHAARLARARGLHVLYKPHVWAGHGGWAGEIAMTSEADWALWFRAYRRYVVHHALLAAWSGADLYSIGCELSKTTPRAAEWRRIIGAVRRVFPGTVTYSANWYGDLETVPFWKELDTIGIDAYFPLADSAAASDGDLERGARHVAARLAAAAGRSGRPILLTEVGFAARAAAWLEPHKEGGEYSEEDQARAYAALFRALGHPDWLAGTFLWKAFSGPEREGGERDRRADFRFLGRRAEAVVREYYRTR